MIHHWTFGGSSHSLSPLPIQYEMKFYHPLEWSKETCVWQIPFKANMMQLQGGGKYQLKSYMGVSLNGGTPESSIPIGFSLINHPFWGTPIFGNTHMICSWVYTPSQNWGRNHPTGFLPGLGGWSRCSVEVWYRSRWKEQEGFLWGKHKSGQFFRVKKVGIWPTKGDLGAGDWRVLKVTGLRWGQVGGLTFLWFCAVLSFLILMYI